MTDQLRGADIVARTLDRAGMHQIFTLSGNHIMEIFDATIGTDINLTHVRQEGAAVLMAGAWSTHGQRRDCNGDGRARPYKRSGGTLYAAGLGNANGAIIRPCANVGARSW